jgi:hypothetical protein
MRPPEPKRRQCSADITCPIGFAQEWRVWPAVRNRSIHSAAATLVRGAPAKIAMLRKACNLRKPLDHVTVTPSNPSPLSITAYFDRPRC